MFNSRVILFILGFGMISYSSAREFRYYARSPKALLMGDAYTAIADDEYTLWYNPAGLGKHSGLTVHLVNPTLNVTNALGDMDKFEDLPEGDTVALANRFIGYPLHLGLGAVPGVKLAHFGMSFLVNSQLNFSIENRYRPFLDIDYRFDRGFSMGYAYTVGNGGPKKAGMMQSFGFAMKYINREGLDRNFALFGTSLLDILNQDNLDYTSIKDELGYSVGSSWGYDLGYDLGFYTGSGSLNLAMSIMDIGETHFERRSGNGKVPIQPMHVNLGMAWRQDWALFNYALSMDIKPINSPVDFGRKLQFGATVGIPLIDFMVGWNGGYLSYGAGLNLGLLRVYAGFYGVELGGAYTERHGKRGLLYLSILDFSFDP